MPESKNQEHTAGETVNAYGSIKISEEAIAGSMTSGLTEMLGKKNLTKGVKVELNNQDVIIALHIFVEYGVKIPKLALEIQNQVRDSIQTMTGLKVKEVNIYVQGVTFDHTEPVEEIEEKKETEV